MGGKTVYIKMIAVLQILAQVRVLIYIYLIVFLTS